MPKDPPKRAFLKRGAGTSRFDKGGMANLREKYIDLHPAESNAVAAMSTPEPKTAEMPRAAVATPSSARPPARFAIDEPIFPPSQKPPPSTEAALTPEQQSLAEFEELEATVQQQARDLAEAAGMDPSIEIFAPPPRGPPIDHAPAPAAPPAAPAPPAADDFMADYDDDDDDQVEAAQDATMTPHAMPPSSSSSPPQEEGLEPEDEPPQWSLRPSLGGGGGGGGGGNGGGNSSMMDGGLDLDDGPSGGLWNSYSIFNTTGGIGGASSSGAAAASSDPFFAAAADAAGQSYDDDDEAAAAAAAEGEDESSAGDAAFAFGSSFASYDDTLDPDEYSHPAFALPRGAPPPRPKPAAQQQVPIRANEPPPTSPLVTAVFRTPAAVPSSSTKQAGGGGSSRIPTSAGGSGKRGGGAGGGGGAAAASEAAQAVAAKEEENRKLRAKVRQLNEQLQGSERGRQDAEALAAGAAATLEARGGGSVLTTSDKALFESEVLRFEEYKASETRRLQKERRVLERQAKALLKVPDRKEREEVEGLKAELGGVRKELQVREARWKLSIERLRKQLQQAQGEKEEMAAVVQEMERGKLSSGYGAPGTAEEEALLAEAEAAVAAEARAHHRLPPTARQTGGDDESDDDDDEDLMLSRGTEDEEEDEGAGSRGGGGSGVANARAAFAASSFSPSCDSSGGGSSPTPLAERTTPAEVLLHNKFFLRVDLNADEGLPLSEEVHADGKYERNFRSGRCQVLYPTGTRKEVLPNGVQTVIFSNGDVKQTGLDRRVVYYYAEAATTHVSEPNGTQLYHFPNGQVERHFTDGLKEIKFADGTLKVILPDGQVQGLGGVPTPAVQAAA